MSASANFTPASLQITCPACRREVPLIVREIRRGCTVACEHCSTEINLVGPVLTEVFWAANNLQPSGR